MRSLTQHGCDCTPLLPRASVTQWSKFLVAGVYTIFTPFPSLFTPFIHRKRYSSISTNKEVHMDLIYVSLAATLAAMTFGMAYVISRSNGRN